MRNIFKIILMAKRYWWLLILAFIAMLADTSATLYAPKLISRFINLITDGSDHLALDSLRLSMFILSVYLSSGLAHYINSYYSHVAAWHFVHDIRMKMYDHIQRLSMSYFHDKQTGQLMSRIAIDTRHLEIVVAHSITEVALNIITLVGVVVILFSTNVKLAFASLLFTPFVVFLVYRFATKVRPMFAIRHQKNAELVGALQDNLSGIREIQVFHKQDHELERMTNVSKEFTDINLKALQKSAVYHPLIAFTNKLSTVVIIGFGGYLAMTGNLRVSDVVEFLLYLNMFYPPISAMGRLMEDISEGGTAIDRIVEVLETQAAVSEDPSPIDIGETLGEIQFHNVTFSYVDGVDVLKDFSLKINPGETVALVGPTGVGKTTIASLLARFYDPNQGHITLDGVDIRKLSFTSLRNNTSYVLQDVFLFNGTVSDNIAYGTENATPEDIRRAADVANASEFIETMPDGFDTIIGERGLKLSGGQKQRISIARAILRNKKILVLDEATSAVDPKTEKLIKQAIDRVSVEKTTIIIAHRLSTIINADKIAVISDGKIVEIGTHGELMELKGAYYKMHNINK